MDRIEDHIRRLSEKPEKVISHLRIIFRIGGIILIILALRIGREKIDLVVNGTRSRGTVVDYKQAEWSLHSQFNPAKSRIVYMPIVEFSVDGKVIHFQDNVGSRIAGGLMKDVPIIFDHDHPETAIIDRPVLNWIPWAPMLLMGFLFLWRGFRSSKPR